MIHAPAPRPAMPHGRPVLVSGGAGYIGTHAVLALREAGREVVVLDDLSTGFRQFVPSDVELLVADIGDERRIAELIRERGIVSVLHFAARTVVPDSVTDPVGYYWANTGKSCAFLSACRSEGVKHFVFSSTAAVYGNPNRLPVAEDCSTVPLSPYGTSKLMFERVLQDAGSAYPMTFAILRYFNVAGADPAGRAGQAGRGATHLIKVVSEVATGKRPEVAIFGDDYPTPDGTGVRDYIHVSDLAEIHVSALDHLESGGPSLLLNCGYGRGYSVLEVIRGMERIIGRKLPVRIVARRPGDMPIIYAANEKARRLLGWSPRYDDLDVILKTALKWERRSA